MLSYARGTNPSLAYAPVCLNDNHYFYHNNALRRGFFR